MSEIGRIGPYSLRERLGAGGMGVVYRAVHEATGETVALKTVASLRAPLLSRLRREVHTLARITHPDIVAIKDHGLHEGMPWYAMEVVDGVSMRRSILGSTAATGSSGGDSPTGDTASSASPCVAPEPGDRARMLSLVRQLCAPLGYLHGEGIVHSDLKPENVMVRPDGRPVIVDFGLATAWSAGTSREPLEAAGVRPGTFAYTSPEQARGDPLDARADLYSLGCMLYEVIAARPPFQDSDPEETLRQHLECAPSPPSRYGVDVPPELDDLVLRLLQKEPRRRLGYAADVAELLGRLGARGAGERPAARAYLYRPGLHGRDDALATVERLWEPLDSGRGELVLLLGESGTGKTRLAVEIARRARIRGLTVLAGGCEPAQAGASFPLAALRRPLATIGDRCRELGAAGTDRLLAGMGKLLARYEPSLRELPGVERHREPDAVSHAAARDRLNGALVATLAAWCDDRPGLLILDDLQWADDLTFDFLAELGPALARLRLVLVATCRLEEMPDAVAALRSRALAIELDRLSDGNVAGIAEEMLGLSEVPGELATFLSRQAAGNPLYAGEYLRSAVAAGLLERGAQGDWRFARASTADDLAEAIALPVALRDLMLRRLEGLDARAEELLAVAAMLGRELDAGLLSRAARTDGADLMEPLATLLLRSIVEEGIDGGYRFLHDKLRDVVLTRIPEERRARLHAQVAAALDELPSDRRRSHLASLAYHLEQSAEVVRARECYLAAARHALDVFALREADRLARAHRALAEAPTVEGVDLDTAVAQHALSPLGRQQEALALYETTALDAGRIGYAKGEVESLNFSGWLLHVMGRSDEGLARFDRALAIGRGSGGNLRMVATTLIQRGNVLLVLGDAVQAELCFAEVLRLAAELADERLRGVVSNNLGNLRRHQGRLEEARLSYEQAIASHRSLGRRAFEGSATANLASVLQDLGRMDESELLHRSALAIAREVGDRSQEALAIGNIGKLLQLRGELAAARASYEEARAVAEQIQDGYFLCLCLLDLGNLLVTEGRATEALPHLRRAHELAARAGRVGTIARCLHRLADAECATGELDEAWRHATESRALAESVDDRLVLATAHVACGRIALARGEDASPHLSAATSVVEQLGVAGTSALRREIDVLIAEIGRTVR